MTINSFGCSLCTIKVSYTAQSTRTVTPCSLVSMEAAAKTRHEYKYHFLSLYLQYRMYDINDSRKNKQAPTSALPTTPATASVCMGCAAKSSPAVSVGKGLRENTEDANCVKRAETMVCSKTLKR